MDRKDAAPLVIEPIEDPHAPSAGIYLICRIAPDLRNIHLTTKNLVNELFNIEWDQ